MTAITGIMIGVKSGSAKWIADTFAIYGKGDGPVTNRKEGQWTEYTCSNGCYCSNCGYDSDGEINESILKKFNFCPKCGAYLGGDIND